MKKEKFVALTTSFWKFQFFLLQKLPAAWFMGIRITSLQAGSAQAQLPFRWRSQNPFRSTYFAAQMAAAEMSTGILVMYHLQENPPISMLVTRTEANFTKKATEKLTFTCNQGEEIAACVQRILAKDEGEELRLKSVGTLPNGDVAGEFVFVWTLRKKRG
jgi:acyl-coenzyme A thioesterase PaaI-like protein